MIQKLVCVSFSKVGAYEIHTSNSGLVQENFKGTYFKWIPKTTIQGIRTKMEP